MRTKQQIVEADNAAKNDAILRMRATLDDALEVWYQKQCEGKRISLITLDIDRYFQRDEFPDEIREELEKAGFSVTVVGQKYQIF